MGSHTFSCIDGHTCSNPIRLVSGSGPRLQGATMLEKRPHFLRDYDWIRTGLMFEPCGHDMMSGSILYPPTRSDCDAAVLFIETSGCLPMCGHGTIGTVTMGIENGLIAPRQSGRLSVDRPAGKVWDALVWLAADGSASAPARSCDWPQARAAAAGDYGLAPIYQRPQTTVPHSEHRTYPYLLRDMVIDRPSRLWCADIVYIPMRRGFLYLVAVMDWATRRVLSWRLSSTMDVEFCVAALEAMARFGWPEISNSDQESQFTSPRFTAVLTEAGVRISMDGRGRCTENVFIERLWRSLKYECVYLHAFETGFFTRLEQVPTGLNRGGFPDAVLM